MYANPFMQSGEDYAALMCVSVLDGGLREHFLHIRVVGPPITGLEENLDQFAEVRILGACDQSCHKPHPGNIGKMMQVGPELREAIIDARGFREAAGFPPIAESQTPQKEGLL